MVNAASPLPGIPGHVRLRPDDLPFWEGVVRARARDEWTEADLVVAAQLARCQRDIEHEQISLDSEGSVIENAKQTMVMNPRHAVLEQLARREMALMRSLRIGKVELCSARLRRPAASSQRTTCLHREKEEADPRPTGVRLHRALLHRL